MKTLQLSFFECNVLDRVLNDDIMSLRACSDLDWKILEGIQKKLR